MFLFIFNVKHKRQSVALTITFIIILTRSLISNGAFIELDSNFLELTGSHK